MTKQTNEMGEQSYEKKCVPASRGEGPLINSLPAD